MRILQTAVVTPLPVLEPGEEIVASTVSVFRQVVVLTQVRGGRVDERQDLGTRVHVHDGDQGWRAVRITGPEVSYPLVELLPGGEILLVGARCHRRRDRTWPDNAHVFDSAGVYQRSFCVGDAIEHVGVDAAGSIWVGYFDEGVFDNYANDGPIGALGLIRFDSDGRVTWRYGPPPGAVSIVDCYALNVDTRTVWAYYYTEFPLVRIADGRARAYTPTPVRGARAVLAYRDEVVFVGRYDDPLRLTHGRLSGSTVEYLGQPVLVDPGNAPLPLFRNVTTRGSRLYLHTDAHVLTVDLADQYHRPT